MMGKLHISVAAAVQAIVEAAGLNSSGDKKRQIVVTGCLAQRYGENLAADLPEADLVMGFEAYGNLPTALADRLGMAAGSSTASSSGRVQVRGRVFSCFWEANSCDHVEVMDGGGETCPRLTW